MRFWWFLLTDQSYQSIRHKSCYPFQPYSITSGYDPKHYVKNNYQLPHKNCIRKNYQFSIPSFNWSDFIWIPSPIFVRIPFPNILSSNFLWISSHQIKIIVWIWISCHQIEILYRLPWPLLGQTPKVGELKSLSTKFLGGGIPSQSIIL